MKRTSWLAFLGVVAISACGHTVLDQRVDRQGDGWTLAVRKVVDGPNRFDKGDVVIKPEKGDRFIWVTVTLRNDQGGPRKFSWDRCDLDAGDHVVVPGMISHDMAIGYATELPREPEMAAGESIDRRLVFVYPEGRSPTRLKCAPMVIPLPQF